jgi:hypothetical protein
MACENFARDVDVFAPRILGADDRIREALVAADARELDQHRQLMPGITSTSRLFMAEIARSEGVPPNMSVSTEKL